MIISKEFRPGYNCTVARLVNAPTLRPAQRQHVLEDTPFSFTDPPPMGRLMRCGRNAQPFSSPRSRPPRSARQPSGIPSSVIKQEGREGWGRMTYSTPRAA